MSQPLSGAFRRHGGGRLPIVTRRSVLAPRSARRQIGRRTYLGGPKSVSSARTTGSCHGPRRINVSPPTISASLGDWSAGTFDFSVRRMSMLPSCKPNRPNPANARAPERACISSRKATPSMIRACASNRSTPVCDLASWAQPRVPDLAARAERSEVECQAAAFGQRQRGLAREALDDLGRRIAAAGQVEGERRAPGERRRAQQQRARRAGLEILELGAQRVARHDLAHDGGDLRAGGARVQLELGDDRLQLACARRDRRPAMPEGVALERDLARRDAQIAIDVSDHRQRDVEPRPRCCSQIQAEELRARRLEVGCQIERSEIQHGFDVRALAAGIQRQPAVGLAAVDDDPGLLERERPARPGELALDGRRVEALRHVQRQPEQFADPAQAGGGDLCLAE